MKTSFINSYRIRIVKTCALFASLILVSGSGYSKTRKVPLHGSVPLQNKNEKEFTQLAKVSVKDAISETNKNVKGDVTTVRLDQRDGYLVYVVEVDGNLPGSYLKEVIIDAGSGKLLSTGWIK